jgi:hypothetical protein
MSRQGSLATGIQGVQGARRAMRGALVRGPMQPSGRTGLPRVPHVRPWLKTWARANGRGAEVDAAEEWERQQRQRVAGLLALTPQEAQQLEVPQDENH